MRICDAKEYIAAVLAAGSDWEEAHSEEDAMLHAFVRDLADGVNVECARQVAEVIADHLDATRNDTRWCA